MMTIIMAAILAYLAIRVGTLILGIAGILLLGIINSAVSWVVRALAWIVGIDKWRDLLRAH